MEVWSVFRTSTPGFCWNIDTMLYGPTSGGKQSSRCKHLLFFTMKIVAPNCKIESKWWSHIAKFHPNEQPETQRLATNCVATTPNYYARIIRPPGKSNLGTTPYLHSQGCNLFFRRKSSLDFPANSGLERNNIWSPAAARGIRELRKEGRRIVSACQ